MIWALLEITLPLCIAALFGLFAGWLFWRWRRTPITAAEWETHGETDDADQTAFFALRKEHEEMQAERDEVTLKVSALESKIETQANEISTANLSTKQANEQLAIAKKELESKNELESKPTTAALAITATEQSTAELEAKLAKANSEKEALAAKVTAADNQAQQLTAANIELTQKLEQSQEAHNDRDAVIAKNKQLEDELSRKQQDLSLSENTNTELERTKTELASLDAKFKNFQASAVAHRQTNDQQQEQQRARIEKLQAELTDEKQRNASANDDAQKIVELQAQLQRANASATELADAKNNITNLNTELLETKTKLAEANALSSNNNNQPDNALRETQKSLAEVNAYLSRERAKNAALEASLARKNAITPAPVTDISVGTIKKLKSDLATKEERITELEKKIASKAAKKASDKAKKANASKDGKKPGNKPRKPNKNVWQKGKTKLGTPGCDHKDDLTAINGIGPKIQKVLNQHGIKSWEQLATLTAADIKTVDEALKDFSGRIKRDEWVPQAKAIMRNGHQPLNAKAKPATAKKPKVKKAAGTKKKSAWQKGKTTFGTPGSLHRDDLKVINGIGPVIEKSLNRRGIRSWEQLASLVAKDVKAIDEALDFPGRIAREQWVKQAKDLVRRYPDQKSRPTRKTVLNRMAS